MVAARRRGALVQRPVPGKLLRRPAVQRCRAGRRRTAVRLDFGAAARRRVRAWLAPDGRGSRGAVVVPLPLESGRLPLGDDATLPLDAAVLSVLLAGRLPEGRSPSRVHPSG